MVYSYAQISQYHHMQSRSNLGHDSTENLITLCAKSHEVLHRVVPEVPINESGIHLCKLRINIESRALAVGSSGLEKRGHRLAIWRKININPLPAVR